MSQIIKKFIKNHNEAVHALETLGDAILQVGQLLVNALNQGNKILVMGNGGSAADAQHLVAELVGRFEVERPGLPAIALTTDTSILTAVSNDFGYENIFARQVEALAQDGDVVVGISTSGNSPNVLRGIEAAKEHGCQTVGLLGRDGGELGGMVDCPLIINVNKTPHIQEAHGIIVHLLCQIVDQAFSDN